MNKSILSFNKIISPNIIYGASITIERILSFLIVPILGRELSSELYAVWSQTVGIIIFITNILIISTPSAIIPFLANLNLKKQLQLISTIIVCIIPIFCIFGLIIIFFSSEFSFFLWGNEKFKILVIPIFFWICSEALFELVISLFRAQQKFNICSTLYTLKYLLRVLILLFFAENHLNSIVTIFWLIVIVQFILICPILFKTLFRFNLKKNQKNIKNVFILGSKISILGIISYFANYADRFLIVHKLSLEILTPYVIAFSIGGSISIIYSSLGYTLFPKLSKMKENQLFIADQFEKSILIFCLLGSSCIGFLTLQGSNIISVLTNNNFFVNKIIIFGVSMSIFINGFQQLFQYFQIIKNSLLSTKIGLITSGSICFLMNWFFLENFGIEFAAILLCLGSLITISIIITLEVKKLPALNLFLFFKFLLIALFSTYLVFITPSFENKLFEICIKFLIHGLLIIGLDYLCGKSFLNLVFNKGIKV